MKTQPRIFVSVPDDRHLDDRRKSLKCAIIGHIASQGFSIVGFEQEQFGAGLPMNLDAWTVDKADALIRRCDGVLVLALARSHVQTLQSKEGSGRRKVSPVSALPTPYNHLEGALALAQQLQVFVLAEENMEMSGIFCSGSKPTIIPAAADSNWVTSDSFGAHLNAWALKIRDRRDVFLGYCSKASPSANEIGSYLEDQGYSILDWARDFKPAGATVFEEIELAASRCRCAIFLFTKDDGIDAHSQGKASFEAIPRDNVLVEAGYFTRARGKERVAIIRETGAKMPSDFGGVIYLPFEDRSNLAGVKAGLTRFLNEAV